ncbi:hypothetical protein DUI87_06479 [Hirundo rustica rustica]|uniref:C-type lectin domain-containing protein n=1 Tax=Hirundo rustica rustica TaxID=333673 RepID=A0A3M0KTB8_HIRRU|nr:hypothetical protein DUI87_06479 [Hirundo rustica rustica]
MEEGVMYADLRFPPTPAPQQRVRLPWCWAALSLGLLSLMLLLAQIILVSLSFHWRCQFCPVGWLWDAGQCYYFSSTKKSWEQSREDCCSRGAQLATIQANTTLAFLLRTANMDAFHVGLKQDGFRSDWKWLDGTTLEGIFPIQRYPRPSQACDEDDIRYKNLLLGLVLAVASLGENPAALTATGIPQHRVSTG